MRKYLIHLNVLILFLCSSCAYESQNREKLESSFEENFGFKPPSSVEKIKLKNWGLYDTNVHWTAFTYDSKVMEEIVAHEQPLNIALNNTSEFNHITEEIRKSVNNPKWLELPNSETERIYLKRDFLDHTFSEYYLWANNESGMIYLFVHYFD